MNNKKHLIQILALSLTSCAGKENISDATVTDSPQYQISVKEMPKDQYGLGVPLQDIIDGNNAVELCINLTKRNDTSHWLYGGGIVEDWEYSFHYLNLGSSGHRNYEMAKKETMRNFGKPSLYQLIDDVESQIETYKVTGLVVHDHDLSYKEKRTFVREMEEINIPIAFYRPPKDLGGPWD